ncbi:hypothetical protein [Yeosuana sp.]|uniref:hypothetical protein n=1 Tax=Yeosuana sp. TaxID=2529388 RepID=UPI004054E3E0|tara:strand:- start:56 stop:1372 length:1317 start_codon:yes stop_codon:yes gene_type:complete
MKNLPHVIWLFLLVFSNGIAQQEKGIVGTNNWLNNWTEFKPYQVDYGEATQILTGNIKIDTKLYKRNVYMLLGSVFVTNGATLTIEPGTVIIGDYDSKASLTICRGATIIADGLETDPIVFTSNRSVKKAGDWGGLFILGDAPTNKFGNGSAASFHSNLSTTDYINTTYGGTKPFSNSGILRYVRIEYAGKKVNGVGNYNALFLGGVGYKTELENIMVSFSGGNAFNVLGGEVNLNKLISYKSNGNDFEFNFGTKCNIFNSLAVRSAYVSSNNGARCINVRSYDKKEEVDFTKKGSDVKAIYLTLFNNSADLMSNIEMGLIKEAVFIGEDTSFEMNKSVISGFNPAVILEEKIKINNENLEKIKFYEMYFNNSNGNIFSEYNADNEDLENWYGNSAFYNVYSKGSDSETFINSTSDKKPDYRLRINKIMASQTLVQKN